MDSSALAPYFKFYDELVSDWLSNTRYLSEKYLPEPWWGWSDSGKPLYAVIINLNPGDGGILQTRRYIRFGIDNNFSYREAMADGSLARHLEGAARWHKTKREDPILKAIDERPSSDSFSANTLCVEIYPFHSKNFDEKKVREYLEADDGKAFRQMMEFAAEASRLIESTLKNTVLIRISDNRWERIAGRLCNRATKVEIAYPDTKDANSGEKPACRAAVYRFGDNEKLKGVRFICIWGSGSRNNFPTHLKELFEKSRIFKHQ